jgi:hypothetical protein
MKPLLIVLWISLYSFGAAQVPAAPIPPGVDILLDQLQAADSVMLEVPPRIKSVHLISVFEDQLLSFVSLDLTAPSTVTLTAAAVPHVGCQTGVNLLAAIEEISMRGKRKTVSERVCYPVDGMVGGKPINGPMSVTGGDTSTRQLPIDRWLLLTAYLPDTIRTDIPGPRAVLPITCT